MSPSTNYCVFQLDLVLSLHTRKLRSTTLDFGICFRPFPPIFTAFLVWSLKRNSTKPTTRLAFSWNLQLTVTQSASARVHGPRNLEHVEWRLDIEQKRKARVHGKTMSGGVWERKRHIHTHSTQGNRTIKLMSTHQANKNAQTANPFIQTSKPFLPHTHPLFLEIGRASWRERVL